MPNDNRPARRAAIDALIAMLQTLRYAPGGSAVTRQIESGARVREALGALVDRAFVAFAKNTTDRYAKTTALDPTTRLKLRMIDRRLDALIENMSVRQPAPDLPTADALEQHLVAALWALRQPTVPATTSVDTPSHKEPVQQTIEAQLDKAIVANLDNIAALGSLDHTLRTVPPSDLNEWRDILRDAAREVMENYRTLGEHLQEARAALKDLTPSAPARETPPADEGFLLGRLDAEARRADRYRQPLSLAMLGPDYIEDIQDMVGPQAVREMLRHYRHNVASCARAYDTVVDCRPNGLLWLLPGANTDQGVLALRKAQQHMTTAHYHYGGRLRPLPTFSAAVVGYVQGEDAAALLVRAEALAAHARRSGPNRIEQERSTVAVAN